MQGREAAALECKTYSNSSPRVMSQDTGLDSNQERRIPVHRPPSLQASALALMSCSHRGQGGSHKLRGQPGNLPLCLRSDGNGRWEAGDCRGRTRRVPRSTIRCLSLSEADMVTPVSTELCALVSICKQIQQEREEEVARDSLGLQEWHRDGLSCLQQLGLGAEKALIHCVSPVHGAGTRM